MVRSYSPILEIGQHTRTTHAFTLIDLNERPYEAIDLTNATEVRLTMEHRDWGSTLIDGASCTIPEDTAEEGYVEYTFSSDETANYGVHFIQFEIDWANGETQLVPPEGTDWTLFVGRRLPDSSPIRAGHAAFGEASIGDLEVETLSVGMGGPYTSLEGPGLYYDDGELGVSITAEGVDGLTNPLIEHMDASGFDILNPRDIGKDASRAQSIFTQELTAGSATVETAPTAAGEVARYDETNALDEAKAPKDGGGTAVLENYDVAEIASKLDIPVYADDANAPPSTHYFNSADTTLKYKDGDGAVHAPPEPSGGDVANPMTEDLDAGGHSITNAGSVETDDLQTRDVNGIVFAHHYDTAQAAVDATTDDSVVVFLREHGPYEPFTIPPRDGLHIYSPNRAVLETSITTGDKTSDAAIIDGPENHPDYSGSRFYDPTPVTGAVPRGTTTITVDNPGQFSQGDVAFLAAGDEIWREHSSWSATNLRGEYVTISAVNADSVEIAEQGPLIDYGNPNGNLSLYQFNAALTNSTIEGLELHGAYQPADHPDGDYSERCLVLNGAHDVDIRNIHIQRAGRAGCDLRGCYDVQVDDLTVDTVGRYGLVVLEECKNVDATGLTVTRTGRYATQVGAPTSGSYAPTQGITIKGAVSRDANLYAYNVHPNANLITFRGCDGYNVWGGIRVRSEKVTLDGGRFEITDSQMIRAQHRCSGLRVRNVDCNPASQFARFDGTDSVDDIRIEGCSTYGETDIAPSAIMLTDDGNVTYGDIRMVDCDIPTLRRYQPIIDISTDVSVAGTITLEDCTFEGAGSVAETTTGSTVSGELIIDGCWISDAGDGFSSFGPTNRVAFLDNRLRNTSISNPGDTIAWSGNQNIST